MQAIDASSKLHTNVQNILHSSVSREPARRAMKCEKMCMCT